MLLTMEEAKASLEDYKASHPEQYANMGGDKITDVTIVEALQITDAIVGAMSHMSESDVFRLELSRICNAPERS